MLTIKGEYWKARENTDKHMIIEKQVRRPTSKGELTRSSKAATVTLAAPQLHSRAVGGLASSRTEQKNSGKCEMQAKGGKFIQRGEM